MARIRKQEAQDVSNLPLIDVSARHTHDRLALKVVRDPDVFRLKGSIQNGRFLGFDGSNLDPWEGAIDRTLWQACDRDPSQLGWRPG